MLEEKWKEEADRTTAAIQKLAENEEALENFNNYLSIHYGQWIEKYASDPGGLTDELERFADM